MTAVGSPIIDGSRFPMRVLVRGALVLGYTGVLGAGATVLRELQNPWDKANLPPWQRPLAYGITTPPLEVTAFAAALLVIVHLAGEDDYLSRYSALLVFVGAAMQLIMGLGFWFLVITLNDRVFGTLGAGRTRLDLGQLSFRLPEVTLALMTVLAAIALLRPHEKEPEG